MEIPVINNMRFESVEWRASMGKSYAFITVEDLGSHGEGFEPPRYKHYWGEAVQEEPEDIVEIMKRGGKWTNLP
jgi:hypothetical protein